MTNEEIDKLEAGPELDALVARKVMGWQLCDHDGERVWYHEGVHGPLAKFSTDIAAAWEVVEKTNLFQRYLLRQVGEGWQVVDLVMDATGAYVIDWCHPIAEASTVMLAIDRAALKVVNDSAR